MNVILTGTALMLGAAFSLAIQDPRPAVPAPAAPKAVPGVPERHPFEGVFALRRRIVAGQVDPRPALGYLVLTHRHMVVCFEGPGAAPDRPLVRAGVRTWTQKGDSLETEVHLGWFNDADGEIHVEKPGTRETRRVVVERATLRILQDAQNSLEFERVE